MTAAERAAGRYMRAEDHSASTQTTIVTPPSPPPPSPPPPSPVQEANDEMSGYGGEEVDNSVVQPAAPAAVEEPGAGAEAAADGDGEAAKPAGEEGKAPEPAGDDKIREANEATDKARREAEYWRGVAEGRKAAPEEKSAEGAAPADDPAGKEPDPKDYEYGDADARYIADLAAHEARKAVRQEQEAARITERLTTVENDWQSRTTQAQTVYPDFQEKVIAGADKGSWACSQIMSLAIKTSAAGADMAYHLATNPAEAARIDALTPLEQAKEMGRLEYRFEAEAKAKAEAASRESGQEGGDANGKDGSSGGAAKPKTVTNAPPPPPRARGTGGRFAQAGDTDDFRSFEAHADQVLEARDKRRR